LFFSNIKTSIHIRGRWFNHFSVNSLFNENTHQKLFKRIIKKWLHEEGCHTRVVKKTTTISKQNRQTSRVFCRSHFTLECCSWLGPKLSFQMKLKDITNESFSLKERITFSMTTVYLITFSMTTVYLITFSMTTVYLITFSMTTAYLITFSMTTVYLLTFYDMCVFFSLSTELVNSTGNYIRYRSAPLKLADKESMEVTSKDPCTCTIDKSSWEGIQSIRRPHYK
jgi:hypothetical protein